MFDITFSNYTGSEVQRVLTIQPSESDNGQVLEMSSHMLSIPSGQNSMKIPYRFNTAPVRWSEYTPVVYDFTFSLSDTDLTHITIGMRSFSHDEHHFLINGNPVMLRGTHDALVFPLTGASPMDETAWINVMNIYKRYGLNHLRYHTCCPPDAAFAAADILGLYLEPELPFWGTVAAAGEDGFNAAEQDYLISEGLRMLDTFGNHPSFVMMSMGNELWGSPERIGEIMSTLKSHDGRFLYTQGSNNFQFAPCILPQEDFWTGVRLGLPDDTGRNRRLIRGSFADCDAPLGHIQSEEPSALHEYDSAIIPDISGNEPDSGSGAEEIEIQYGTGVKKVRAGKSAVLIPHVPVVAHEAGQYAIYPNYREIYKYRGVLKPKNLETFRDRLIQKGMGDEAYDFFYNSGKLAVQCYKEEIEAFHRSSLIAGYQLLDIKDYPGQGTSLVGILDAFMESKELISVDDWRSFCSDKVLLASFDRYNYFAGDKFEADILLSWYDTTFQPSGLTVTWSFGSYASGCLLIPSMPETGLISVGRIEFKMPECDTAIKERLHLTIEDTDIYKDYPLWFYPENNDLADLKCDTCHDGVFLVSSYDNAVKHLSSGDKVIFFPEDNKNGIPGFYCTTFWNYPMFRDISVSMNKTVHVGTMGLSINRQHPALSDFACETYTTPQWYTLLSDCECAVLDNDIGVTEQPAIQMIDNFERCHRLGILYEKNIDGIPLLICTSHVFRHMERPEVRQFVRSLLKHRFLTK